MSHFSLDLFRSCSRIFKNSLSSALYGNETQKLSGRSFARNARGARAPSGYVQKILSTAQVPVSKLRRLLNHDARLPALVGLVAPRENRDRVGMVEFTQWTSSTNTTFWPWGANNPQLWRYVSRHLLSSLLYRVVNIHPGSKNCKSLNSTRREPIGKLIYNSNNSSLWMFMVRVTIFNGVYKPPSQHTLCRFQGQLGGGWRSWQGRSGPGMGSLVSPSQRRLKKSAVQPHISIPSPFHWAQPSVKPSYFRLIYGSV